MKTFFVYPKIAGGIFVTILSLVLSWHAYGQTETEKSLEKKEINLLADTIITRGNRISLCFLQLKKDCFETADITAFNRYIPIVGEMHEVDPSLLPYEKYNNLIKVLRQIMKDAPSGGQTRAAAQKTLRILETKKTPNVPTTTVE